MKLIQLLALSLLNAVSLKEKKLISIDLEEVEHLSSSEEQSNKKSGSFLEEVKAKFFTQKNSGEIDFLRFKKNPKEPLTNSRSIQYTAKIEIGTPPQEFKVILDTQSTPLWVTGIDCADFAQCFLHRKFDHSKSKSYSKITQKNYSRQNLYYAYVNLGQDKVKLGKLEFDDMSFGSAYYRFITSQLPAHADGVLGLGLGENEEENDPASILDLLKDQGLDPIFSLYLNNKQGGKRGGTLELGGYDSKHFKGRLNWYPLSSDTEWAVKLNSIKVQNDELELEDTEAVFDVSLPWIEISPIVAELLNKQIGGQLKDPYGPYYLNCANQDQLPNISFKLGKDVYTLKPEDYVFESYDQCISVIQPIRAQGSSKWVLGNRFLKKYYTVFDGDKFRVGLAKL